MNIPLRQLTGVSIIPKIDDTYFFVTEKRNEKISRRQIGSDEEVNKELFSHLFGGKIKDGENYKSCGIREFIEEFFGISVNNVKVRRFVRQIEEQLFNVNMDEYQLVSSNGKYHIFLTFDVNNINNQSVKEFFTNLDVPLQEARPSVESVFKWTFGQEIENPSSLLIQYLEYLKSKSYIDQGGELSDF